MIESDLARWPCPHFCFDDTSASAGQTFSISFSFAFLFSAWLYRSLFEFILILLQSSPRLGESGVMRDPTNSNVRLKFSLGFINHFLKLLYAYCRDNTHRHRNFLLQIHALNSRRYYTSIRFVCVIRRLSPPFPY